MRKSVTGGVPGKDVISLGVGSESWVVNVGREAGPTALSSS